MYKRKEVEESATRQPPPWFQRFLNYALGCKGVSKISTLLVRVGISFCLTMEFCFTTLLSSVIRPATVLHYKLIV